MDHPRVHDDAAMMDESLEQRLGRLLRERRITLGLAESCTGGLIAHRLTNIPGSSDYLLGGVVSYSNAAKEHILGVQHSSLETHGAVSEQAALEMARGAQRLFASNIAWSHRSTSACGGTFGIRIVSAIRRRLPMRPCVC